MRSPPLFSETISYTTFLLYSELEGGIIILSISFCGICGSEETGCPALTDSSSSRMNFLSCIRSSNTARACIHDIFISLLLEAASCIAILIPLMSYVVNAFFCPSPSGRVIHDGTVFLCMSRSQFDTTAALGSRVKFLYTRYFCDKSVSSASRICRISSISFGVSFLPPEAFILDMSDCRDSISSICSSSVGKSDSWPTLSPRVLAFAGRGSDESSSSGSSSSCKSAPP